MREQPWVQVEATAPAELAELAADVLWRHGTVAIEEQTVGAQVRLLGAVATEEAAAAAVGELADLGVAAVARPVDAAAHGADLDAWRDHASVERAGAWWLVPSWTEVPSEAPATDTLHLDPGRTFGSGSHPTTRLVLTLIDRSPPVGGRVLDVGCGSGVLAVAAARRGAREVRGIDIDPEAPAATRANAERNGVAAIVQASTQRLAEVVADDRTGGRDGFDLVLANLLAPTVRSLGADLVAATAPGGHLVVSGLLADRWRASMEHLAPLEVQHVATEGEWAAIVLGRGGATDPR